ncbi:DUF2771 family protein [Saccharopolyspora gloriosae]|uniref:DUF2771 family protein n=1 Tax=Saccharopolyspora gloriosae TaxID=455344 RepID=UPI001FB780DD|nr:DUF2771 family protein [Saccharopolyspora gloriosae]
MHRGLKSLLLAAPLGIAALAGCSAPADPQVTFYSHGEAAEVAPARFCDANGEQCSPPPAEPVGRLTVPEKAPLQISVPGEVSGTPWQVAYIYRGANGEEIDGRTPVFTPDSRRTYTLRVPPDGTRLEHVEVQQYSAVLTAGDGGGVDFGISGTWVLDPR